MNGVVLVKWQVSIDHGLGAVPVHLDLDRTVVVSQAEQQAPVPLRGKPVGALDLSHLADAPAILLIRNEHLRAHGLAADSLSIPLHGQANPVVDMASGS